MSFVQFFGMIPNDLKHMFRELERVNKKLINSNWSVKFNLTCINENMLPNYSNFRLHDQAANALNDTTNFRWRLVERQIEEKKRSIGILNESIRRITTNIDNHPANEEVKNQVMTALNDDLRETDRITKVRILKKLNNLYNGEIFLKKDSDNFTNLSDHTLSEDEKEFLNLGLNYHLQNKYDKLTKETEMEVLYQKLLNLKDK